MHIHTRRRPNAALPLLGLLCLAATPAAAEPDSSGWPDWLRKAMQEESGRKYRKPTTLELDEGRYKVRMPGTDITTEAVDGGWYLTSDIGAESGLECYVITDERDLATLTHQLAEANIAALSEAYGTLGMKQLFRLDAGVLDAAPYLALEWLFTVGEAPNAAIGFTKVRVARNGDVYQACVHNGPGYRLTFAEAFGRFVQTAEITSDRPVPYYREITVVRIGEQPIGVGTLSYTLDADNDTFVQIVNSFLVPVDVSTLQTSDSYTLGYSTPEGEVINSYAVDVENGELVNDLELSRGDDDEWIVSGTFQAKAVEYILDGSVQPLSELGHQYAAAGLIASDREMVQFPAWVPSADPTTFIEASIRKKPGDGRAVIEFGPISLDADIDETGSIVRADFRTGALEMQMERAYVDGRLP